MFNLLEVFVTKINYNILRENVLNSKNMKIESKIDLKSKYNKKIKLLEVIIVMNIKGFEESNTLIDLFIELTGIFAKNDNFEEISDNALEIFSKVKAPAILFPFLLENIHSLTFRSKIKPLIVPLIDFEKLYFENKKFNNIIH